MTQRTQRRYSTSADMSAQERKKVRIIQPTHTRLTGESAHLAAVERRPKLSHIYKPRLEHTKVVGKVSKPPQGKDLISRIDARESGKH